MSYQTSKKRFAFYRSIKKCIGPYAVTCGNSKGRHRTDINATQNYKSIVSPNVKPN